MSIENIESIESTESIESIESIEIYRVQIILSNISGLELGFGWDSCWDMCFGDVWKGGIAGGWMYVFFVS